MHPPGAFPRSGDSLECKAGKWPFTLLETRGCHEFFAPPVGCQHHGVSAAAFHQQELQKQSWERAARPPAPPPCTSLQLGSWGSDGAAPAGEHGALGALGSSPPSPPSRGAARSTQPPFSNWASQEPSQNDAAGPELSRTYYDLDKTFPSLGVPGPPLWVRGWMVSWHNFAANLYHVNRHSSTLCDFSLHSASHP